MNPPEGKDKTFFTGLPQTQSELEEMSIDSADYQIKEYVKDLFYKKKFSN